MLDLSTMIYRIPALLFAISIHEYAHAQCADSMGDSTARNMGRLGYACCIREANPLHSRTTEHFSSWPGIRNGAWSLFGIIFLLKIILSLFPDT